jgi:hypothetical protein
MNDPAGLAKAMPYVQQVLCGLAVPSEYVMSGDPFGVDTYSDDGGGGPKGGKNRNDPYGDAAKYERGGMTFDEYVAKYGETNGFNGIFSVILGESSAFTIQFEDGVAGNLIEYKGSTDADGAFTSSGEIKTTDFLSSGEYSETSLHHYSQLARKIAGWALAASIPLQKAFERASLYGPPQTWKTTLVIFEKTVLGKKISQPLFEMGAVSSGKWATGLKTISKVAGAVGGGLAIYDMSKNGVTTSNALDLAMSTMALTGFGTSIAGAYFVLNAGSILLTGKDIGQHIDAATTSLTGKSATQYINEVIR